MAFGWGWGRGAADTAKSISNEEATVLFARLSSSQACTSTSSKASGASDASSDSGACPASPAMVNESNMMPDPNQKRAAQQSGSLSTARVSSTIPISERNKDLPAHQRDAKVTWQYPSEQMFYNAILRKGWRVGSQPALNIHSLDDFFSSLPISLNVPRRAPHRVM
mmetsp:Transcript_19583/g.31693  ORF Transcript_19583/g.31693 Transcript_19583/m.31693 type:complete len:166 (+) Transcript_19583:169-666(+)